MSLDIAGISFTTISTDADIRCVYLFIYDLRNDGVSIHS